MNKLFKPRCLRRIFLCLALMFPIVYLCGGLFFALAGAHGEQMFAEPVYTQEYIETDSIIQNKEYRISIGSVENILSVNRESKNFDFSFTYNNYNESSIRFFDYNGNYFFSFWGSNGVDLALYYTSNNTYRELVTSPWVIYSVGSSSLDLFITFLHSYNVPYDLLVLSSVPSSVVPENNSAYTDFIFSQPFAKDNFITTLGIDLVNGSTKGFNPMNDLFRYVNDSVLHFDDSDGLAMFGLGYVYYSFNVLIVYEILVLAVKLIMLPLKAVDVFDKEDI